MADSTYGPKVYKDKGGDRLVIASGGELELVSTTLTAATVLSLLNIVAAIPTVDPAVAGQVWLDNGVLVVSEGP